MCDTFIRFLNKEHVSSSLNNYKESFFAKNSDRDPGEPQIIQKVIDAKVDFKTDFLLEKLAKYTACPLGKLKEVFPKYKHKYGAIISRPVWIWGAEMGVNEKGVSIGNEAVFSKEKLNETGLLGMDILRLALHNSATADEAADFIIHLIETYGQCGNGSYSGSLKYHNSFLIKDFNKAIVLETSAKTWVRKDFTDFASISNAYTLSNDFELSNLMDKSINFKKKQEQKFYTFFSEGDFRQNYTCNAAQNHVSELKDVFSILRSHIRKDTKITRGMKSVCVHPGILVKSETTMSMVIHYTDTDFTVWHTSSPNPCVSLYKPLKWETTTEEVPWLEDPEKSLKYFKENRLISEYFVKKHTFFHKKNKPKRNVLEENFIRTIVEKQLVSDCYVLEVDYKKEAKNGK